MGKVKIILDRENCIGAGACAAMDSDHFEMSEDGKVDLKGGVDIGSGKFEIITEDSTTIQDAAKACPVEVIKIEKVE